jgi:hypothetical protein
MDSWRPNEAGVQQIVSLLIELQNPAANQPQVDASSLLCTAGPPPCRLCWPHAAVCSSLTFVLSSHLLSFPPQILAHVEGFKSSPDFNNHLAFIFADGRGLQPEVRQGAGLLLKNNLRAAYSQVGENDRGFVKSALLRALGDKERTLRHTAGTCVAAVAELEQGLGSWPALAPALSEALDSGDPGRLEAALDAIYKVGLGCFGIAGTSVCAFFSSEEPSKQPAELHHTFSYNCISILFSSMFQTHTAALGGPAAVGRVAPCAAHARRPAASYALRRARPPGPLRLRRPKSICSCCCRLRCQPARRGHASSHGPRR